MTLRIRTAFLALLMALTMVTAISDRSDARNVYGPEYVDQNERYYYSNPDRIYTSIVDEAMRKWDRLDDRYRNRGVQIRKADAKHPATVIIHGVRDCDGGYSGFVPPRVKGQPGAIYLNTCSLDRYGRGWKLHVTGHEIGHTLGFEHAPNKYRKTSIMTIHSTTPAPGGYDEKLYRNRWIR